MERKPRDQNRSQLIALRAKFCERCCFWSDQKARIDKKRGLVAKCLNSIGPHRDGWMTADSRCSLFREGGAIDLPKDEVA